MSDLVIQAEHIYKQYRLGKVGRKSLHDDINRWMHKLAGKEDPYLQVGDVNDRTIKGNSDYIWALQDISFSIKKGDVLGIIGRNGAGKSTLLKILSKVTAPTKGNIKIKGRIASLLEVGTGFHPELSGRDNIFLNGAILGMTRREIQRKFDEIVAFAGVERYIDTPVKRYSSGMYVRLAFAVAAHLEPDILIVDEVLAVGDAEFQKKCLGKMKDVSVNDGRTILFVSHNIGAIQALTDKCLFLKDGIFAGLGSTEEILQTYLDSADVDRHLENISTKQAGLMIERFEAVRTGKEFNDPICLFLELSSECDISDLTIGIGLCTWERLRLFTTTVKISKLKKGRSRFQINPKDNYMPAASYIFTIGINIGSRNIYYNEEAIQFEIEDNNANDLFVFSRKNKLGLYIPSEIKEIN